MINLVLFLCLFSSILATRFRYDPSYDLIEFPLDNITDTTIITSFLSIPYLPADEPEIEYYDGKILKVWLSRDQQKLLETSSLVHYPGIDQNHINFLEAKAQNYRDPTNGDAPDWTKYCDSACWVARAKDLAANCAYPVALETYGKSVKGRDLVALKIGSVAPAKGPILLGGNIHGDEPVGNQLIQRYAWETCNSPSEAQKKIATTTTVWYQPFFNPDGYEAHQRANGNNVDLNRNFPVIKTPRAQVETTAYMNFAKKIKPSYGTMYHGGMAFAMYTYFDCYDKTIIPRCPPGDTPSDTPRGKDFKTGINVYAGGLKKAGMKCDTSTCAFNVINDRGYSATGVSSDWAAAHNNQVDITIEVDHTKWPSGGQLPHYYGIHMPILNEFCLLSVAP